MWKRLTHPNILPLLGVTIDPPQLVSDWMPGGDLQEYIKKNADANRLELVGVLFVAFTPRLSSYQLSDVAKGLCYLHSCNVIHGDLKGVCNRSKSRSTTVLTHSQLNIFVDDSGGAHIADFGLAKVTQNLDSMRSASPQNGHSARWTAPEVLKEGTCSKEGDIFSFAMVMIEVRHGYPPRADGFGSPSFCIGAGVHRRGSIQSWFVCHGHASHNSRQAPATPDTSDFHRGVVGVDATLLESSSSLAPGSFRSLAGSSHPVSLPLILTTIHLI